MSSNILVVAEHVNGTIDDITFELLGKGRELADDGGLAVALLGGGSDLAGQFGKADRVLHVDHLVPEVRVHGPRDAVGHQGLEHG